MPDDVNNDNSKNCFKNFGYNKIYYNPSITYLAPKKADGTPYADANFTAAYPDGFNASGATVNLNTSFKAYSGDSSQKAYYYEFTANPASPAATCSPNNKYTKVTISSSAPASPAAAQKNFANWYSYYRTRINMMKSASGRAFSSVDDGFPVSLDVISNSTASGVTVKVAKFNAAQKASWYASLYGAQPNGANNSTHYTPLRGALSKAGRMYAGKVITGSSDPVQYSCQQNFTILTTDGYWNLSDETNSYGPKEDNVTNVGDQDGVAGTKPPYLDSGKYNTLADISMYYYRTDLRPTVGSLGGLLDDGFSRLDVSTNNVPAAGSDTASWQHMTLYGLGLVAGTLTYDENYLKGGSADYNAILQGTKNWPNPDVTNNSPQITERIDDLWHAGGDWSRAIPERVKSGRRGERAVEDARGDLGEQRSGGIGRHEHPGAGGGRELRVRSAIHHVSLVRRPACARHQSRAPASFRRSRRGLHETGSRGRSRPRPTRARSTRSAPPRRTS